MDFIWYILNKRLIEESGEKEALFEDMIQESYLYFLKAIEGYQYGSGTLFVSYLSYY